MPALEDDIRSVLADAADRGRPDMTKPELEALAVELARKLRPRLIGEPGVTTLAGRRTHVPAEKPTDRQMQLLALLADGTHPQRIAEAVGISRATVHDHLRRLAGRFGVPAEACLLVNAGFERGWLSVPVPLLQVEYDLRDRTGLRLLAAGRGDELGAVLGLSEARVRGWRGRLRHRFGVSTDAGLVAGAWRAGALPVVPVSGVAS